MSDPVHNPSHYKSGGIEVIDVIEAFELGFRLANVVKYVLRAGRKGDALEDLEKAAWYLDREIDKLETQAEEGKMPETMEVDITSREDVANEKRRMPPNGVAHVMDTIVKIEKQEYDG